MAYAPPAHVGNVQQPVKPVQVHEHAEIGNILGNSFTDLTDLNCGQQILFLAALTLFNQFAPGQDDIPPLGTDLDDLEIEFLADIAGRVAHRHHVNLRARQEGIHTVQVHNQTAADHALDHSLDNAAFLVIQQHAVPAKLLVRLLLAQNHHSVIVFDLVQQNVQLVAHVDLGKIAELAARNDPFGFVADVHQDFVASHFENCSRDDGSFNKVLDGLLIHLRHLGFVVTAELRQIELYVLLVLYLLFHNSPTGARRPILRDGHLVTNRRDAPNSAIPSLTLTLSRIPELHHGCLAKIFHPDISGEKCRPRLVHASRRPIPHPKVRRRRIFGKG